MRFVPMTTGEQLHLLLRSLCTGCLPWSIDWHGRWRECTAHLSEHRISGSAAFHRMLTVPRTMFTIITRQPSGMIRWLYPGELCVRGS
jgi:hypothetical protein